MHNKNYLFNKKVFIFLIMSFSLESTEQNFVLNIVTIIYKKLIKYSKSFDIKKERERRMKIYLLKIFITCICIIRGK